MKRILVLLVAAAALTPSSAGFRKARGVNIPVCGPRPGQSCNIGKQEGSPHVDTNWGTIKGRVTWGSDKLPELPPIVLPDNHSKTDCLKAHNGKPPPNETWVIHKDNKGLKNTFVWLASADKKPIPIKDSLQEIKVKIVEVGQSGCQFVPHALALREGQVLRVKNTCPFAHNFKWSGSLNQGYGGLLLPGSYTHDVNFVADRLPILIECNLHPWMRGWVRVFDHPYYAVTDHNGAFEIADAPAGNWRLMVWHGGAGWKGGTQGKNGDAVVVEAGKTRDLGAIASYP